MKREKIIIPKGEKRIIEIGKVRADEKIEFLLEPFSKLQITYLQTCEAGLNGSLGLKFFLEEGADLESLALISEGDAAAFSQETFINGKAAISRQEILFLASGKQKFDIGSMTFVNAPQAYSIIEARGILDGESSVNFAGNIKIENTAKNSDSRLDEKMLILSPRAKINTVPAMRIRTSNSAAAHCAAISRVDDDQMAYCASRGLNKKESIRIISGGFLRGRRSASLSDKVLKRIQEKICKM